MSTNDTESNAEQSESNSWGEDGFEHLRKYTRNGSEFFKEIIGVLEERVILEEQYAKGLQKLSIRLMKTAARTVGNVDTAWKYVATEMENESVIHRNLGNALEEEIVKPLKTVQIAHQKTRKTIDTIVEKSIKQTASRRSALEKAKKTSHHLAADLEKMMKEFTFENRRSSKSLTEKQAAKISTKRIKLEEGSFTADQVYHDFCVAAERQRQELELVLTAAALRVESLEETRLANLQTALGRYHCHLSQLGPGLTSACAQQFQTRIDPVLTMDVRQDLAEIVSQSQPNQQGFRTLVLCDFYAEDLSNPMNVERRRAALLRYLSMFEKDVEKERKTRQGSEILSMYDDCPLFNDAQTKLTIKDKLYDTMAMLNFIDYHLHKLNCCLSSMDASRMGIIPRDGHRLSKHEHKMKDKMGFRQTLLRVPLPETRSGLSTQRRQSNVYVSIPYERREAGDGQSPSRKMQLDNESDHIFEESTYEHLDNESSVDNFSDDTSSARTELCQALYDFRSQQDGQLTVYAGDIIRITEKLTNDWWQGELSGQVGLFPSSYVKEL